MNHYHIWANHKPGINALEFASRMRIFLDQLIAMGKMQSYSLTRMKLGFRSIDLPEFHIAMQFKTMQQMDDAMTAILENENNIDDVHVAFNQLVDGDTIQHALYRDYPDEQG
jgi:hypothetical protein